MDTNVDKINSCTLPEEILPQLLSQSALHEDSYTQPSYLTEVLHALPGTV